MKEKLFACLLAISIIAIATSARANGIKASNIAIKSIFKVSDSTPFPVRGGPINAFVGYPRFSPDGD